jgi:hypothetical protein
MPTYLEEIEIPRNEKTSRKGEVCVFFRLSFSTSWFPLQGWLWHLSEKVAVAIIGPDPSRHSS